MRSDQTDRGQDTMTARSDGWSPERATGAWQDIKSRFVDDPAGAVAAAEQLVQQAVEDRIRAMNREVEQMCARDETGDGAGDGDGRRDDASSTEGLRTKLIRYQEYCERLAAGSIH
jgi:hypothetical protein